MTDKRIKKTKKNLKATIISMMSRTSFENISITALCKEADISRITFYTHYSDKYALVDEIFEDMIQIGGEIYQKMQAKNNPEHNYVQSYCNVLNTIMELYYTNYDFFRHTVPEKNPYLASSFYSYVLKTVETYTQHRKNENLNFKYSPRKVAGFLCYGLVGFINESHTENTPFADIQKEASTLLTELLTSDVLVANT